MHLKAGQGDGIAFPLSFHPSPMSLMAANNSYRGCYHFLHLATVSQPVPLSAIAGGKCSLQKPPPTFERCLLTHLHAKDTGKELCVQDSLKNLFLEFGYVYTGGCSAEHTSLED